MDFVEIFFSILAGFIAGVINTLAGSGSIITLSLLSFLGLSGDMANGTNRLGILAQGLVSTYKFKKHGRFELFDSWLTIILAAVGAVGGMVATSFFSPKEFNSILGWVFCFLFFVLLFQPHKRISLSSAFKPFVPFIMLIIGFYAGFIQAGAGVFMLTVLNAALGKKFTELNPLKVFIITIINLIAVFYYALNFKIVWVMAICLAVGQYFGGMLGVRFNNTKKNIEPVIRIVLLILVVVSILKFWGIVDFNLTKN